MTTNTATPANRIAAGVTAAYVLDLTRRAAPAPAPRDGRRAASHGVGAARFRRRRDDCGPAHVAARSAP